MAAKAVVLVTRKLPDAVLARLRRDYDARINETDRPMSGDDIIAAAAGCDGILVAPTERMTAEVIAALPASVGIIASYSVGYDHVDVAAARRRGLVVTNTPDVLTDATAEIAVLLMLGAARRAYESEMLLRRGEWKTWAPTFMLGSQISGKRLGIIGLGRIGRATARRARGFDMEIHYHNRARLAPELEAGAIYHSTVEDLLPRCQVLSIHAAASAENRNLLDAARIALLPDGAIVVNTARGSLVDDDALIAALRSGKLGAAGLDVFADEPNIDPRYPELPNTMLLPHIGSATRETRDAMGFRAADNLDDFFARKAPRDRVA